MLGNEVLAGQQKLSFCLPILKALFQKTSSLHIETKYIPFWMVHRGHLSISSQTAHYFKTQTKYQDLSNDNYRNGNEWQRQHQ